MAVAAGEQYLTNEDLAERYKVPLSTVRYWRLRGTGPDGIRIGGYVRYDLADVQRWERGKAKADRERRQAQDERGRLMSAELAVPFIPPRLGAIPHYQGGQWSSWDWIDGAWLDPQQVTGEDWCPVAGYDRHPVIHIGIEFGLEIILWQRAGGSTAVPPFLMAICNCSGHPAAYLSAGSLPDALDLLGRWAPAVTADVVSAAYRDLADTHPDSTNLIVTMLATARAHEDTIGKDVARITRERAEARERRARQRAERKCQEAS